MHGAPTVMAGLVYFATCGSLRPARLPLRRSAARTDLALDARTGKLVWTFPDGQYSPVVADGERVYLAGRDAGLRPRRAQALLSLSEQGRATAIPVSGQIEVRRLEDAGDEEQHEDRDREAGGRLPVAASSDVRARRAKP